MTTSRRRTVKQYGLGCAALALLAVLALAAVVALTHLGYREARVVRDKLDRAYDTQEEYTPPASGEIEGERLRRYLAVREALQPLCARVATHRTGLGQPVDEISA